VRATKKTKPLHAVPSLEVTETNADDKPHLAAKLAGRAREIKSDGLLERTVQPRCARSNRFFGALQVDNPVARHYFSSGKD
jgi:hypothetical protein